MNDAVGSEGITMRCGRDFGRLRAERPPAGAFFAACEATYCLQDSPRERATSNDLLAMTRLASPNRLNSCASFFARLLQRVFL